MADQPPPVEKFPGDFAVVSAGGIPGRLVGWLQELDRKLRRDADPAKYDDYQHAFIYTGLEGDHAIIQAEPAGTDYASLTPHGKTLWSTGKIPLTDPQRALIQLAADSYLGVPYSFLDYAALILHRLHVRVPWLKRYIASTKHQICSQLVDQVYLDAGVHLFDDGRWPGYVTPADLAELLDKR